jgi:4,5-dihydroxyphthalate decarboxylase
MRKRRLKTGIALTDRVLPLIDGSVVPSTFDLEFDFATPDSVFRRALNAGEFDLAEMSFAAYCILLSRGDRRFVGLPVFTSRAFRHGAVYVRDDSDFTHFSELTGRRIGLPHFVMTAAVWVRGLIAAEGGVDLRSIHWFAGGVDTPRHGERLAMPILPGYRVTRIGETATLAQMLRDGDIDAVISARAPHDYIERRGVRRLIADPLDASTRYFEQRRIFPIMHLLVMRREGYEADPPLVRKIYDAFCAAKDISAERLADSDALFCMAPWLVEQSERTRDLMGNDYWPYGVARNTECIEEFLWLLAEQQLVSRALSQDELFAGELSAT